MKRRNRESKHSQYIREDGGAHDSPTTDHPGQSRTHPSPHPDPFFFKAPKSFPFSLSARLIGASAPLAAAPPSLFLLPDSEPTCSLPAPPRPVW